MQKKQLNANKSKFKEIINCRKIKKKLNAKLQIHEESEGEREKKSCNYYETGLSRKREL